MIPTSVISIVFQIAFSLLAGVHLSPINQQLNQWSPVQEIPAFDADTQPPYLVADNNGTVHAFASQWVGEDGQRKAIIYSQWTLDGGWTPPVDILLSPLKDVARLIGAYLDSSGMMHVIFFGGDNTQANIYYAQAPATSAGSASAWSTPVMVGKEALNPENGAISGGDSGNLLILFSGMENGNGIYAVYSPDHGITWSNPEPVYLTQNVKLYPFDTKIYKAKSGLLHVVWSNYDQSGNSTSVYYNSYDPAVRQWISQPILVSEAAGLSDVIEYEGRIIVVYHNYRNNGFLMRESLDGGTSWSNPVRIAGRHVGRNGVVSLGIDSNQGLHFFFSERITGSPDIHGVWHSTLKGNEGWTEPEPIVSGPQIVDLVGENSFDPFDVRAIVSQGNVLLVTWRTDPGLPGNGVKYSFMRLNSPGLPVEDNKLEEPFQNPSQTQALVDPTLVPATTPEPTATASTAMLFSSQPNPPVQKNLMAQISLGIIPVVALLLGAFLFKIYLRYKV